jgi:hypothetical protein
MAKIAVLAENHQASTPTLQDGVIATSTDDVIANGCPIKSQE